MRKLTAINLAKRINQLILLFLIIWAFAFYLRSFDTKLLIGDEGFALNCSHRILKGETPSKNFFTLIPPYSFLPLTLAFKIFGSNIMVSRFLALFMGFIFFLILNIVLNNLNSPFSLKFFCFSVLVPYGTSYWPIPSHHWWVTLFSLLSIYMLLILEREDSFFRKNEKLMLSATFLAGFFAQLSLLSLHDQGGYLLIFLSLYLFILRKEKEKVLFFYIGVLIASIPFFVWIIPKCGIMKIIQDLVVFPITNYHNVSGHKFDIFYGWRDIFRVIFKSTQLINSPLFSLSLFISSLILFVLPLFSILGILFKFFKREQNSKVLFLTTILFFSAFLSSLHRWSLTNLVWILPCLFPSLIFLFDLSKLKKFFNLIFIFFGLIFILFSIEYYKFANNESRFSICGTNGCLRAFSSSYQRSVNSALQFLENHKKEGDTLFCFGFVSLFNFLSDMKNPTYFVDFPAYHSEEDFKRLKDEIEINKVNYVLIPKSENKHPYFKDFLMFLSKDYILAFENTYFAIFYRKG